MLCTEAVQSYTHLYGQFLQVSWGYRFGLLLIVALHFCLTGVILFQGWDVLSCSFVSSVVSDSAVGRLERLVSETTHIERDVKLCSLA